MKEIDKNKFLTEFEKGDIWGLDNLDAQIMEKHKNIYNEIAKNKNNFEIIEKLSKKQEELTTIYTLLQYVKDINYIYVEAETNKNLSKYYNLSQNLYFKTLNDLFDMLNIKEKETKKWKT